MRRLGWTGSGVVGVFLGLGYLAVAREVLLVNGLDMLDRANLESYASSMGLELLDELTTVERRLAYEGKQHSRPLVDRTCDIA